MDVLSPPIKTRLATWLSVVLFGAVAGSAYAAIAYDAVDPAVLATLPGMRAGALIAAVSAAWEIFAVRGPLGIWFRRRPFLVALAIRVLVHCAIVFGGLWLNSELSDLLLGRTEVVYQGLEVLQDAVYAFAITAGVLFVLQMRALIGARTLGNVVIGRYHRPITEERLFVMIDLVESTPLAQRIGNERFHGFLYAFFFEIDAAVSERGGEIYSYVGDSAIASWPLGDKDRNARALAAVVTARARLARRADWFSATYGAAPKFRAAIHCGSVVAGECGDSRRQITYLGDALNVTARLEGLARAQRFEMVISQRALSTVSLPKGLAAEDQGVFTLKGVREPMRVSTLTAPLPVEDAAAR